MDNRDPSLSKLPPQAIDIEEAILSAILLDNGVLQDALGMLNVQDFYRESNAIIFRAMASITGPIDLLTLSDRLREQNELDVVGGASILARLVDAIPSARNVEKYCKIVQDKAIKRQIIQKAQRLVSACYADSDSGEALLDRYQQDSASIDVQGSDEMVRLSVIIQERLEYYEKISKNRNMITGVPSGFGNLDRILSGFQPSDLILLAARPGMGKSAIALNMAMNASKHGQKVGFFSLEMSKEQLVNRFFATQARFNLEKTRSGHFNNGNLESAVDAGRRMYEWPFYVEDKASMHFQEIHRTARRQQIKHGLDMAIVDHIQITKGDNGSNESVTIGSISRALKKMAKDLNIPVIALSQLNRDCTKRDNKRPQIVDLKQSGSLEEDADVVMFLHRESEYRKDIKPEKVDPAELSVSKQRNGRCGVIHMGFNGAIQEFLETDQHTI